MERLIFALTVIGATLACAPQVPPNLSGKGYNIAYVHLISTYPYEPLKVQEYMGYFPQTKIEEYSKALGDFMGLGSENYGGYFAYTFYIANCECEKVLLWMNAILKANSQYYKDAKVDCYIPATGGNPSAPAPPGMWPMAPVPPPNGYPPTPPNSNTPPPNSYPAPPNPYPPPPQYPYPPPPPNPYPPPYPYPYPYPPPPYPYPYPYPLPAIAGTPAQPAAPAPPPPPAAPAPPPPAAAPAPPPPPAAPAPAAPPQKYLPLPHYHG